MSLEQDERSGSWCAWVLPLALAALSCGAAPPPPQAPAAAPSAPVVPPVPKPADLSEVAAPPSLVLSVHLAKPSVSLATVRGWTRMSLLPSEEVTELLTGEALGPLVDLDQPIDVAVTGGGSAMRPSMHVAVAAALQDADHAKSVIAERFKLVPGDAGALIVEGLGRGKKDDDGDEDRSDEERMACEIAPAYGAASSRLVCGLGPKALSELGPWLTRGATRAAAAADVHLDFRMAPVRPLLAGQKHMLSAFLAGAVGARLGTGAVRDLVSAVGNDCMDFALDLDSWTMDLDLGAEAASIATTSRFVTTTSTLSRALLSHPERNGPAPASFQRLPADADVAFFSRGLDESDFAHGRDLVLVALGELFVEAGMKDVDRTALVEATKKVLSISPQSYSGGLDEDAARKIVGAALATREPANAGATAASDRAVAQALFGWRVFEADEPAGPVISGLKDWAAALARPGVRAFFRSKVGWTLSMRVAPLAKGSTLPAGSQHFVIEFDPTPPANQATPQAGGRPTASAPLKPIAIDLLVVPDGDRLWGAAGAGEALLTAKLGGAMSGTGDKLLAHAQLAPLKEGSIGAGGFFTPRSLVEWMAPFQVVSGAPHVVAELFDELGHLPHHGASPIAFTMTPAAGGPPSSVELRVTVPKGVVEDVVAAILRHGGF